MSNDRTFRYCPPIELRVELLGVSEEVAADQLARCQARVAEAFGRGVDH